MTIFSRRRVPEIEHAMQIATRIGGSVTLAERIGHAEVEDLNRIKNFHEELHDFR